MSDFKGQAKQVVVHIPNRYSKEMATKSEVVSTDSINACLFQSKAI